jgi:predicted DNA-binding protein
MTTKIFLKKLIITNMTTLTINLPKKIEKQLTYLEVATNKPKNFHIQEALIRYLEELEDICDALQVSNKKEKTYTTAEVRKKLKLK